MTVSGEFMTATRATNAIDLTFSGARGHASIVIRKRVSREELRDERKGRPYARPGGRVRDEDGLVSRPFTLAKSVMSSRYDAAETYAEAERGS
jgi:hypothetical protein